MQGVTLWWPTAPDTMTYSYLSQYVFINLWTVSVRDNKHKKRKGISHKNIIDNMEEQPLAVSLNIAFGLFVNLQHLSNFVWKWLCVEKGRVLYYHYVRQAYNNYNNYQLSANNTLRTPLRIKITLVSNRYLKLSSFKFKGHRLSIFFFFNKQRF